MDAGRSGAAPGRGVPLVGRHDRRGPAPPRPGPHRTTQRLLDALREAGPGRGCWTWWGTWQSPRTCGAVARHQLQEIAVHTYDAQLTAGAPQPLPDEVALDGVEDFLFTCCATTAAWPHRPAVVDYHATEAAPGAPGCPPTAHGPPACPARPRTRPTPPPGARPPAAGLAEARRRLPALLAAPGLGAGGVGRGTVIRPGARAVRPSRARTLPPAGGSPPPGASRPCAPPYGGPRGRW
ncbi:maleylpyruvate isomerase N-terminal domain-containing protein [Streptomyces sp. NPDC007189]|uniref:maleylpyruvate isomerase N-terminal domain-containing protein n=1 Tax=Streptomyces sp. NPDC007189 TaxID=3154315 RepID=UPI0034542AA6